MGKQSRLLLLQIFFDVLILLAQLHEDLLLHRSVARGVLLGEWSAIVVDTSFD